MVEQERIERAYRLAFPGLQPPWKPAPTSELAWADATSILHLDQPATSHLGCLSHAILALALLDEGGGTLGRWEVFADDGGEIDRILLDSDTYANRNDQYQWVTGAWPASAYLDGTATELTLLMCAADELARREVEK